MNALRGTVLIAAGGTGGHVIPALEVANELRSRGIEVVWVGTRAGIESRLVPDAGIDTAALPAILESLLGMWLANALVLRIVGSIEIACRRSPTAASVLPFSAQAEALA